ncbi:MAG: glutamate--cysteine ligase [Deltaproteobacteria bacterium]|nr:glutamate--cysteine ligase [Deltaproteobacteria bacterium]
MSSPTSAPDQTPIIESIGQLEAYFRGHEKPRDAFRVGMEHEKVGLSSSTLQPLAYFGPGGIEEVLKRGVEEAGFEPIYEHEAIIGLKRDGTSVTLEPGGQLELSGAILEDNHATCKELTEHAALVHRIGDDLGILWLGTGHHPFARREDIHWMPKGRYAIMRSYLPTRGGRALDMMLRTGTVQANYDYASEEDMVRKMRAALSVTSLVSAIYANSPLVEGKLTGWVSERQRIWLDVDPDRTGLLPFVFDEDFGYQRYLEWALDVPMFFLRRRGQFLSKICGVPFRRFLEEGFEGIQPRMGDFEDHLTTLFPEVRLKGYLEVRGADGCRRDLNCALPALWKGILYDDDASEAAIALMADVDARGRERLREAVAREGLEAKVDQVNVLERARELLAISQEGLKRQACLDANGRDERVYLEEVDRILSLGKSPGHLVAEFWQKDWGAHPERLAEHCKF